MPVWKKISNTTVKKRRLSMNTSLPPLAVKGNVLDPVPLDSKSAAMIRKTSLLALIALATAFCGKKEQAPATVEMPANQGVAFKEVDHYRTVTKTSTVMRRGPGKNFDAVTCKLMNEKGDRQPGKTLPPKYIVEVIGRSEKQDTIEKATDYWLAVRPLGVENSYMSSSNCDETIWVFGGLLEK